jgi:hypothetical protein
MAENNRKNFENFTMAENNRKNFHKFYYSRKSIGDFVCHEQIEKIFSIENFFLHTKNFFLNFEDNFSWIDRIINPAMLPSYTTRRALSNELSFMKFE